MSGPSAKEIILTTSHYIREVVESPHFNLLLFGASLTHLIIITMNDCHSTSGENAAFCAKAWINCKAEQGLSFYTPFAENNTVCRIRTCLEKDCEVQEKLFDDRTGFADIYSQFNFWMRWVYTAVTTLRMWALGLALGRSEDNPGFLGSAWSFLDFLVVVAAWLNVHFQFGNLMFFMVLRGFKVLLDSTTPMLATPRVQMKAIGMGLYKVFLVFILMNFILGFISLLAMSLIGSKGDFHNRCAVPLRKDILGPNGQPTGEYTFTYEPVVPEVACRMDHLYDLKVDACYADVWAASQMNYVPNSIDENKDVNFTGCLGTCGRHKFLRKDLLGNELDLNVVGEDWFNNTRVGSEVYCIGPVFRPLNKVTFPPTTYNDAPIADYVKAETSNWPAYGRDPRNFDNIGQAAIVLYTIFYRNAWTETLRPAVDIAGHPVILGWILLMIFSSYYLLNITVSITCSHYSAATETEAALLEKIRLELAANKMPVDDDDDDGGFDDDLDEIEEDQGTVRDQLLKSMTADYPALGHGMDCFTAAGTVTMKLCNIAGGKLNEKYPILKKVFRPACLKGQELCYKAFRACCHRLIKIAIYVNFPAEVKNQAVDDYDEDMGGPTKKLGNSIISRISVACMIGCMITQGLQNANINLYKCECTDSDIRQIETKESLDALRLCGPDGLCYLKDNGDIEYNTTCVAGRCLKNSPAGYPCYNPRFNPNIQQLSDRFEAMGRDPIRQTDAESWMDQRGVWCQFGQSLHFALYGWAFIFLLELFVRYIGHQGAARFFTTELQPGGSRFTPNFRNIADSVCILATVAGIVITELTFESTQALLAGVSFASPGGFDEKSPGWPWLFKLLRLATLIRLAIRINYVAEIPAVAVILRGFRGAEKVAMGILFLILMIFFFALLGKEIFDYGYVFMKKPFESLFDFGDMSNSMLPLLQIMIGSGWYSYTKAGIDSLGVSGFIYFALFYFIVNFQFLRIFIAIIVQNYELTEQEKLEAQKLILFDSFEKAERQPELRSKFTDWNRFSFNTHYFELLRGAQITLRRLEEYQRQVAESDDGKGLSEENEAFLAGEDEDEEEEKGGGEEDEADKVLQQIEKIDRRLNINKYEINRSKKLDEDDAKPPIIERIKTQLRVLVKSSSFNFMVMIVVIASTVFAVIPDLDEATKVDGLSNLLSLVFLGFFVAEMSIKMMAYGFFGQAPLGYFQRGWCQLDFVLVCLQIFDVMLNLQPDWFSLGDSADIFKGFRAVRILRLLARLQNLGEEGKNPLKVILQAIGASLPALVILLMAVVFQMFIFALVGIDQYSGLLYRCVTEDPLDRTGTSCDVDSDCFPGFIGQCTNGTSNFPVCAMDKRHCFGVKTHTPDKYTIVNWRNFSNDDFEFPVPRTWSQTSLAFDNIWGALFTIFSLINKSRIGDMLVQLVSVTRRDEAPVQLNNGSAAVYIIILIIVVGIFISQVVIGLLLTNIRLKSGLAFHTKEQLVWPATKDAFDFMPSPFVSKALTEEDLDLTANAFVLFMQRLQMKFQRIKASWKFDLLMTSTVAFNVGLLATLRFDMPGSHQVFYFWGGFACFCLYVFEFTVKTCADARNYFINPADQFDIFLTIMNAMDLFVFPGLGLDLGLASLRMFRLFRLFTRSETFVRLLETIQKSFPQAVAAVAITFMVIFVFSAVGSRMFTYVKEGKELDSTLNNFSSFLLSMIALFRVSSGANWGEVMEDAALQAPRCTPKWWTPREATSSVEADKPDTYLNTFSMWEQGVVYPSLKSDCGLSVGSYVFFLGFIIINNYLLLPTFVASIIASYFEATLKDYSLISYHQLVIFRDAWLEAGAETVSREGKFVSVLKMTRNPDPATQDKKPFNFDKFDGLLRLLDMNMSQLAFSRSANPDKYKVATNRMRDRATNNRELQIPYRVMAVMLLSIAEKHRPVTIVDILRRDKARRLLQDESRKPKQPPRKQKMGMQHASMNLPEPTAPKKKDGLKKDDVVFSYNVYVVLDQLRRLQATEYRLSQPIYEALKKLVDDNDEDLFVYFEEYVEKSGPVYQEGGSDGAWRALLRFAKKARDVYDRSKYGRVKDKLDIDVDGPAEVEEAEHDEEDEEDEEEHEEDEEEEDDEDGDKKADRPASDALQASGKVEFGEVLEDEQGLLDLRNWTQCAQCGEPVDKNWDRCPNCGLVHHAS